jgi:hypothetical protein
MDVTQSMVKTYKGKQEKATSLFQSDAAKMAKQGYFPTSQNWAPGSWGFGSFLIAFLLCLILVGFLIFVYMLIVKPAGTLTVTYEKQVAEQPKELMPEFRKPQDEKVCPECAETVKAAAKKCRFCGHSF